MTLIHDTWATSESALKVELYYSSAWHDISSDVGDNGVQVTRGRANEGQAVDPARCSLTLRNTTGTYSPRNPKSPLYGLIGRNTPIRVSVLFGATWHTRFYGEVTSWPQRWGLTGAPSSTSPIECSGIMRRLGQGSSPVRSPLYRACTSVGAAMRAYWPMEDSPGATSLAPAVGDRPGMFYGSMNLGSFDEFTCSSPIPRVQDASARLTVPSYPNTGQCQVRWLMAIPESGLMDDTLLARIRTNSSLGWVDVHYSTANGLKFRAYTNLGVLAYTSTGLIGDNPAGRNIRLAVEMLQSGPNVVVRLAPFEMGMDYGWVIEETVNNITLGSVSHVDLNPGRATLGDTAMGHVTVESTITDIFGMITQLAAHSGERASTRISRLSTENGVPIATVGTGSARLGPQKRAALLPLLQDAAATDGGILFEPRDAGGLKYRTLSSLYSQAPGASITYSDNLLLPFEPVDDDANTRNKVTVTREGGSSATVEDTTSAMSTQAPPNGVGVYDEAVTLSLADDSQPIQQAGWRVHLGTVNEARWPRIGVDLAHPTFRADPALTAAVLGLDLGDRLDVSALPSWLPPFPVQAIVQGYTEAITPTNYKIEFNCTPASPYRAAKWKSTDINDRWGNDSTTLAGGITALSTSMAVSVSSGPLWTHADGDFDIVVSGERMTVKNVSGSSSPQTFTVTRRVNGVLKSHSAGEKVTLFDPVYYGL